MFRCDICEKVFKEKCYLSGKYAHGEQDFKCEKCDKKMVKRKDTIKRSLSIEYKRSEFPEIMCFL